MNTKEMLIEARKLIENPDHWCQHRWGSGQRLCAASAVGALWHQQERGSYDTAMARLEEVAGMTPWRFNDTHTHTEVLAMFDDAIAVADRPEVHPQAM